MELLVLILLGTSGLYAIVFVASSYFSAASFTRQAGQTVSQMQDQIGLAMGDLRELQEQTEERLKAMLSPANTPANYDQQIAGIAARLAAWRDQQLSDQSKLELLTDESAAAHLDALTGSQLGALPELYLGFSLSLIHIFLQQRLDHVAPIALGIKRRIVAGRRGLRSNISLAVYPHDLRHRIALHDVAVEVSHHFFRRAVPHRVPDAEVLHELGDVKVGHRVEGRIHRLEAARPVLVVELRENLRGVLAMRASGVDHQQRDHLPCCLLYTSLASRPLRACHPQIRELYQFFAIVNTGLQLDLDLMVWTRPA